jgi:hypothetical protein
MKGAILRCLLVAGLLMLPAVNSLLADLPDDALLDYHIAWTNSAGQWDVIKNLYGYDEPLWTNSNLAVLIDNEAVPDWYKMVWLEVDWASTNSWPTDLNAIELSTELSSTVTLESITQNTTNAAITWVWTIDPQPGWETITFPSTSYHDLTGIDRIDIGTFCIPEPSTMMLVGFGIAALALRAHRRRSK